MINASDILAYLECPPGQPAVGHLNQMINAYIHKVPWESVFRITKRARTPDTSRCPRWPEEFWHDAINLGGGGTCYETNYAFFWLLQQLGYLGYLTINDMGDQRGCHAAIVLSLEGRHLLVDVGIPLLTALRVEPGHITRRKTWLHNYTIRPDGFNRYQVLRDNHPKPNIYTLLDTPVNDADFRRVVELDYGPAGLFLNRVILVKVIGNRLWRFSSSEQPYRIESFGAVDRQEILIPPGQEVQALSERFRMDADKISAALQAVR